MQFSCLWTETEAFEGSTSILDDIAGGCTALFKAADQGILCRCHVPTCTIGTYVEMPVAIFAVSIPEQVSVVRII